MSSRNIPKLDVKPVVDVQTHDTNHEPLGTKRSIGKTLREVSMDMVRTDNNQSVVSRWYKGASATELFTWADKKENIIRQQLSFNGEIVEWNCLEGLKTGVVVELDVGVKEDPKMAPTNTSRKVIQSTDEHDGQENQSTEPKLSESIRFDKKPQREAIRAALEILEHTVEIDETVRSQLIDNFKNPQAMSTMSASAFIKRFGMAVAADYGWWSGFKSLLRSWLKKS